MATPDPLTLAVREYAAWCDLVCRLHRFAPDGDARLWWSPRRAPDLVPDAVTLVADLATLDVLGRIHDAPGASIADSFATLDLAGQGWIVDDEERWIARPPTAETDADAARTFTVVRERYAFGAWCRAWGAPDGVLPVGLRRASGVTVLGRVVDDRFADGGIVHRTVVGGTAVAGVWHPFGDRAAVAIAAAHRHPDAWLVSAARGPALDAARAAGFADVGPLAVWRRGPAMS